MSKVKNINNTTDKYCKCGSWIKHWRRFSKDRATQCSVCGCWRTDVIGAHVIKVDGTDKSHYILPLCGVHNHRENKSIMITTMFKELISANINETCGK